MSKAPTESGKKKIKVTSKSGHASGGDRSDYFESRWGGTEVRRRKPEKRAGASSSPWWFFRIFFSHLSGTVKVGYRCPTNPSPSHTTPETWAIFSHLAAPFVKSSQPTTSDQKEDGGDSQQLELTSRCGPTASNWLLRGGEPKERDRCRAGRFEWNGIKALKCWEVCNQWSRVQADPRGAM